MEKPAQPAQPTRLAQPTRPAQQVRPPTITLIAPALKAAPPVAKPKEIVGKPKLAPPTAPAAGVAAVPAATPPKVTPVPTKIAAKPEAEVQVRKKKAKPTRPIPTKQVQPKTPPSAPLVTQQRLNKSLLKSPSKR